MDIRNGLSQNTVYQILQDRKGFMWFGTKDGLNRYDGLSYRVYKKENSGLGKNFITALYEDHEGNIWIGTDGGVFIYNPVLDSFTAFNQTSDKGTVIKDFVTMIGSDEYDNIWISVENQGLFCYNHEKRLRNYLHDSGMSNVARFWLNESTCWLLCMLTIFTTQRIILKVRYNLLRMQMAMRYLKEISLTGMSVVRTIAFI